MVGSYKLMHGEEITLYEIELIAEEAGSLVLKVSTLPDEVGDALEREGALVIDDVSPGEGASVVAVGKLVMAGLLVQL